MNRIAGMLGALTLALVPAMGRAAPPMWVARSPTASVTLFGSVHLLTDSAQWKTPELEDAIQHADAVWFEIPIDPATQASAGAVAMRRGLLPAGHSLETLLPPAVVVRLHRVETEEGLSPQTINRLQPWLAETLISVTYYQRRGASSSDGVEMQVAKELPPTAERRAFETVEQQIGFFADASLKDQTDSLGETLREIEEEPDSFDKIVSAWLAGDERGLVREAIAPMKKDAPGAYKTLVVERNRHFADQIVHLLDGRQRILVVVGAGHLVGPDGVPALLKARGVQVERTETQH
jgi:uncharacterized protein YbaP (TraB family)